MKKNVLKRTLAMLLVLATLLSAVPAGVLADPVVGNITTGSYAGNTGIVNSTLGKDGYINWPIKIYDYLNDGMLFEPATGGVNDQVEKEHYGGGAAMPVIPSFAVTVSSVAYTVYNGVDYTTADAYSEYAYTTVTASDSQLKKTQQSAVDYTTPRYLRLTWDAGNGTKRTFCPVNYYTNPYRYPDTDTVRYITLVYRASGIQAEDVSLWMNVQSEVVTGDGVYGEAAIDLVSSDEWTYLVVDLKEALKNRNQASYWSGQTNWTDTDWEEAVPLAFFLSGDSMDDGDYIDLTHMACFGSEVEARNFGEAAVAFDNNPGQYLKHTSTITLEGGQPIYKEYDAADEPGYNLSPQNTNAPNVVSTSKVRFGLNFALGTGQNTTTYGYWKNRTSLTMYGTTKTPFTPTQMTVKENNDTANKSYVTLSADSTSNFVLTNFSEQDANGTYYVRAQYAVLVYRAHGFSSTDDSFGFWSASYKTAGTGWGNDSSANYVYKGYQSSNWITDSNVCKSAIKDSPHEGAWVYNIVNLSSYVSGATYMKYLGMYLPTAAGKSLDLAYVAYFYDNSAATTFATAATAYMNAGLTYQDGYTEPKTATLSATRKWIGGNNTAFGLLGPSQFGGWSGSVGGDNANTNGYHTYRIGESLDLMDYYYSRYSLGSTNYNNNRTVSDNKIYYVENVYEGDIDYVKAQVTKMGGDASTVTLAYTGTKDKYCFLSFYNSENNATAVANKQQYFYYTYKDASGNTVKYLPQGYDMSNLSLDGYTLYNYVTGGKLTAGLLESGLDTTGGSRTPVYRQETVAYVAEMLYNTLTIAETDGNGNYHYNFIKGTASDQYGGVDLNGDGEIGMADLDGDTHYETNEASVDLATALRYCLNIKFTYGEDSGAFVARTDKTYGLGSYADTLTRASKLKGTFKECRDYIYTCTDAAYFLLNNIFVENSYSQAQDEYQYLTLGKATLTDGGTAYVFDGGFAAGGDMAALEAGTITQQQYMADSKNAVFYDKTSGTISIPSVDAKDLYYYGASTTSITTRFPFLPVTDSEGPYAGESTTYYFQDDGFRSYTEEYGTYQSRNYNYVMASNGEFVYYEDDNLFFEFEGDDDVYLFINGQLVLDIGGAHSITKVKFNVNDYVEWARNLKKDTAAYAALSAEEKARVDALALEEEQICSFDFYYMERHGYGANCRIVTNMHVTDPNLKVEKSAQQFGEEVSYGGVVEPASPIGYTFKLTNTGNTKLYNLTFTDDVIGVTLDPEKGLVVENGWNGNYVFDAKGGTLEASDLTAKIITPGTDGDSVIDVSFADNQALINFLKTLSADGTESGQDDAEVTHAGSGLWVDTTVIITGMHYLMNSKQIEDGMVHNTVYVTATTKKNPTSAGSQTLRSDASHRVYTAGAPIYYQWAGHEIFLKDQELLDDATREAGVNSGVIDPTSDSHLSQYNLFFAAAENKASNVHFNVCDKKGIAKTYQEITDTVDNAGNNGFEVNYEKSGSYTFYLLMYLNADKTITYTDADNNSQTVTLKGYSAGTAIGSMAEGSYAIVPVTIHVADVQDSTFVLDYGLGTESLDVNGELFKDDELFGSSGAMKAKLMGVSTTAPSYLKYSDSTGTDYNRISFNSLNLSGSKKITPFTESGDADGYFTMNMTIPGFGKTIAYDSTFGGYTITGVGTVTINAEVPASWEQVYLYYWYGSGGEGKDNGWPGTAMNYVSPGKFRLDIPADVSQVIINNGLDGADCIQTGDMTVTDGMETTIILSTNPDGSLIQNGNTAAGGSIVSATAKSIVDSTAYIQVPLGWGEVYLYTFDSSKTGHVKWPGTKLTKQTSDGYYIGNIPSDTDKIVINNGDGNGKQTADLDIYAGQDVWVTVSDVTTDGNYNADFTYSANPEDPVSFHVKDIPADWGSTIKLYAWHNSTKEPYAVWPGTEMTLGEDGWYTLEGVVGGYDRIIITDGTKQTGDLMIHPGKEVWVRLNEGKDSSGHNTADLYYHPDSSDLSFTFTPTKIMDSKYSLWMAITVHSTGKTPSALGTGVNINHEVQMYKKVTVLPATVVYYEDDFSGITYQSSNTNSFTYHGEGSGSLTQSVDQTTAYGSDPVYQSGTNALYSGDRMTKVQINGINQVAAFTFTGTGLELISRTNAFDSATIVMKVYETTTDADGVVTKVEKDYDGDGYVGPLKNIPLITEFDNGNNGGLEEIYQVPAIRVKDLTYGTYIVEISGNPAYDFSKWDGDINTISSCMIDTYLYIDGIRIYQPLGETDTFYSASESGAVFKEFRDLILEGKVAVADWDATGLKVSSGTTTWTENLLGDDFGENSAAFVGNKVGSADDYMIKGPNNEVYMDGTVSNTALAFYVAEDATQNHELQIALRALDYGNFYATGSTGLNAVVEYGTMLADGTYVWRPLVNAVSSTEQYYSIPYAQCPVVKDSEGNDCYQIALRAVNGETGTPAMVSYTSLKLLGLTLQNVTGVGESTNLYYQNGILIENEYYLCTAAGEQLFDNGTLTATFDTDGYVYVKSVLGEKTTYYSLQSGSTDTLAAVETAPTANADMIAVPAGTVTFTLTDNLNGTVTLSYTGSGSGGAEGASEPTVTALNLVSLQYQMQAKSLAAVQIETAERVQIPGLEAVEASLSFDDEIHYNIYFTADDLTDVAEMGLLLFSDRLTDGTVSDAAQIIPGYYADGDAYVARTDGVPAKNMGDTIYFKIYAKLTDGSYAYSDIAGYNAVAYANSILANSQNAAMKSLVVAMLNYGAEAQRYFGYNTDALMNAGLTAEQQALVTAYDADLIAGPVSADSGKLGSFTATDGFTGFGASVAFEGAFAINYYVTVDEDADVTMYYWSQTDYNAADVLTAENATGAIPMTGQTERYASVTGIAAKSLEDTVYVAMVYEADGVRYCTGVKAYSLAAYCKSLAAKEGSSMQSLAKATAVYGYSAKQYFAQ